MKHRNLLLKIVFGVLVALLLLSLIAPAIFPQTGSPRQEKLLNGLKLLMFSDRTSDKVYLKVRIHSGSAFDPQGKEGLMKLLSNNVFPNDAAREYFAEDLGGSLAVESNYDYIQINTSANADKLLELLETVATAVTNPPIDKENTAKLKSEQLALVSELGKDPSRFADRMAAERLLGTFPYGRPQQGTAESIRKIDFADLLEAKQRFWTADNATVVLSGRFDNNLAFRAVRRNFGAWLKSDRLVSSTFRQPDDPPAGTLILDSPDPERFEVRFVTRGTSRGAADAAAYQILSRIVGSRLRDASPVGHAGDGRVRSEENALPGTFWITVSGRKDASAPKIESAELIKKLFATPISDAEFQEARRGYLADYEKVDIADRWLNVDTYKLDDPARQKDKAAAVTMADANSVLDKIKKQSFATVVVSSVNTAN